MSDPTLSSGIQYLYTHSSTDNNDAFILKPCSTPALNKNPQLHSKETFKLPSR